jgi:WD40 repeat protein
MEGHRGELTCLRMSPNGLMIAAGDSNREIVIWDAVSTERLVSGFVYHTSRVTSLSWGSTSTLLVSAAVDGCVILWDVEKKKKLDVIRNAHNGVVNTVLFIRDDLVASGGSDAVVKTWSVSRE